MKIIKFGIAVIVAAAFAQSPTIRTAVANEVRDLVGQHVTVAASDQATFERLCPLMDAYFQVDGAGQVATGKAITTLSAAAAKQTEDPAVRAFLHTVPVAVATGKSAQTRAAKALVSRECAAHDTPLTTS